MRKQVIIGAILLALAISGGSFAISYTTATSAMDVNVAGTEVAQIEPASEAEQPHWESVLPMPDSGTETLRPEANGAITEIPFQHPFSGDHWDKVDDLGPDNWSTYVYTSETQYKRDLYRIPDHNDGSGNIDSIAVYFRFGLNDKGHGNKAYARAVIRTHGHLYTGDEEKTNTENFITRSYQWTTNPWTGEAWTWDEIDSLQIGVDLRMRNPSEDEFAACTQVYVVLFYTEDPVTQGQAPTGDLFIITPDDDYTGDLMIKLYLANTGDLVKAYKYLNMKLYLEESEEAEQSPNYQMLTLENGVVAFHLKNYQPGAHTLSVTGGSYWLVSGDMSDWEEGWSVEPELFCEIY